MGVKLSIKNEQNTRRAFFSVVGVVLLALFCFVVTAILSLAAAHLAEYGINERSFHSLENFLVMISKNPLFLPISYGQWWHVFLSSLTSGNFRPGLFIPLAAPLVFIFILVLAYIKSSYSLSLWFVLRYRFARLDDVKKMKLIEGFMLVLGQFQEFVLGLVHPASILCFGEAGSGKTSSVAIPSILRSDMMSVLAVDNSGTLAKYTSGYRARLGKVFYFNWDLGDDPDKGNYYPRWNPLSQVNLPPKGETRDKYLGFLAGYLVSYDHKLNKENYWEWLVYVAMDTFLHFMVSKVSQAIANDYFLNQLLEKKRFNKDDRDVLLSYYLLMPPQYGRPAMQKAEDEKLSAEDYFPVGSWEGIPSGWQGKSLCLSMTADWLLKNYLNEKEEKGDWKDWLEELLAEAVLFNYSPTAVAGLRQLSYLSKKQRQIVFPMLMKPLMVFRNKAVRERTTGNDFNMGQLRGIRNRETKQWEPVTVYSTANTKSTKFISRMFMEVALRQNLAEYKNKGSLPLLVVMDDVGQMLKVKTLKEAVARGPRMKISFLLLCNSLHNLENLYGRETLEDLVANTNYKIVLAEDNKVMSRQLNKLAIFGTKSVQIPAEQNLWSKKLNADANYYHRLARDLQAKKNLSIETRGYQLVLAEGFYHRPVLAENIVFLKNDQFREKALIDACYFLDSYFIIKRNRQDILVPDSEDIIHNSDIGIDDSTELDQYMTIVYDEAMSKVQEAPDIKAALVDDISNKWRASGSESVGAKKAESENNDEDWWLSEKAFNGTENQAADNPFEKK